MSLADLIANVVKPWLPIRVWNCTVDNLFTAAQSTLAALTVSNSLTFSAGQPAAGPGALLISTLASPNTGAVVWQQSSGTWTMSLLRNSSATGITFAVNSCLWYQFGNCVLVTGFFTLSAIPALTGATVTIGNLPVLVGNNTVAFGPLELTAYNPPAAGTTGYYVRVAGGAGSTSLQPVAMQAGLSPATEGTLLDTGLTAGTSGKFSVWYSSV